MLLYAVTDRMWIKSPSPNDCVFGSEELCRNIKDAILGGATCIQLREKNISHADFVTLAKKVKEVTDYYNVMFIIDDDVDVMSEVDADGVHVGQHDENCLAVRRRIGKDKILGVSAQTVFQALEAEKNGADYLGVGAVFSTSTKNDADDVSLQTLKEIKNAVNIPVIAIGGISIKNVEQLAPSNIDGVAVVSAIFASENKLEATKVLKQKCSHLFEKVKMSSAIFDLDGTLVDSMPMWEHVADNYLLSRNITPPENLWDFFKVMSLKDAALYFQKKYFPNDSVEKIIDGINEQTAIGYSEKVPLKEGVLSFLKALKEKNIPCAIATATDRKYVEVCLRRLKVLDYFKVIKTCSEVGQGKDNPKVFDEAAAACNSNAKTAIVFEDAAHAIRTAIKAGYRVAAVEDAASFSDKDIIFSTATWYGKTLQESFPIKNAFKG